MDDFLEFRGIMKTFSDIFGDHGLYHTDLHCGAIQMTLGIQ